MSVSLNPTRVDKTNVEVVKSELRTVFHIKALGQHQSLSTRANLGTDIYTNLNHAESVARYWLKDCLENHESCAKQDKQSPILPLRIIEIRGEEATCASDVTAAPWQARHCALSSDAYKVCGPRACNSG